MVQKETEPVFANRALGIAESLVLNKSGEPDVTKALSPFERFKKELLPNTLKRHESLQAPLGELNSSAVTITLRHLEPREVAAMIVASKQPEGTTYKMGHIGGAKGGQIENVDLAFSLDKRCSGLREILAEYSDRQVRAVLIASTAQSLSITSEPPSLRSNVMELSDLIGRLVERGQPSTDLSSV